jgi:hypothetical protein
MPLYKSKIYQSTNWILKKVQAIKNTHEGDVCYIFGDGPSIKYIDLEKFTKKFVIGLNYFLFHPDINKLSLQSAVLSAPFYFYPIKNRASVYHGHGNSWYLNKASFLYRKKILEKKGTNFFVNLSNLPMLGLRKNLFYLFHNFPDDSFSFFNQCRANEINPYSGSLTCAITIATYMGFHKIYLVGCDYTHESSVEGHWYEPTYNLSLDHSDYAADFFRIAKMHVNITTITISGGSRILDSITYEQHTSSGPCFRPLDEILDQNVQQTLMTEKARSDL